MIEQIDRDLFNIMNILLSNSQFDCKHNTKKEFVNIVHEELERDGIDCRYLAIADIGNEFILTLNNGTGKIAYNILNSPFVKSLEKTFSEVILENDKKNNLRKKYLEYQESHTAPKQLGLVITEKALKSGNECSNILFTFIDRDYCCVLQDNDAQYYYHKCNEYLIKEMSKILKQIVRYYEKEGVL